MIENTIQPPSEPKKRSRSIWVGIGIGGGVLALCLCVAVILIAVFDPWGIVARLTGGADPIAQAVPSDTQVFLNMNLLKLQSKDTLNLINIFLKAAGEEEIADMQQLVEKLEETSDTETEITFTGDIQPWIGQFIGLGLMDVQFDTSSTSEMKIYLIVEARNKKKADEFLTKLMGEISKDNDQNFIEQTYQGTTIFELDTDLEDERVAFARPGGLLIVANGAEIIKELMDVKKSDSLANSEEYRAVIKELPKERLLTFFIPPSFMDSLYQSLDLGSNVGAMTQLEALEGMGMSFSTVEAGMQMDFVASYNLDQLSEQQKAAMQATQGEVQTATFFPEKTYLYFTSTHLDQGLTSLQEGLAGTVEEADIEEAMQSFANEFGFNPQTDLLQYLDGEWALGLFSSSEGLLAEQLGVPISLMLLAESSDENALLNAGEKIADGLQNSGQFQVARSEAQGMKIYELQDAFMGETALAYGVKDGFLFISTDVGTLEAAYGDRLSLEQSDRYKEGWKAFPSGAHPLIYLDIEGLLELMTESLGGIAPVDTQETNAIKPIKTIEIGSLPMNGNMAHSVMIVFIEGNAGQ
jgi:hypothetical protein